jgi:hypothetical protein
LKASFSKVFFGERYQIASLGQLRERLLNILLSSTFILEMALFAIYLLCYLSLPGVCNVERQIVSHWVSNFVGFWTGIRWG